MELELELAPRPEYGLVTPLFRATESGGRTFGGPNQVVVSSGVPTTIADSLMSARFTVMAGQQSGFALQWVPPEAFAPPPFAPDEVAARIQDTVQGWRSWEADHDVYRGPRRELVRLSSRVLKGLTYRPTGAIVAAPTTSLPETVGGERNWDYRFSWIRDSSLTLEALYIGACSDEAEEFVSFMTSSAGGRASGRSLQIMYGIAGEHDLTERELSHLRGWRDSSPVRVGNGAWGQTQLDVYGELLNSLYLYREQLGELHPEIQRFVADLANTAARRWREPDAGMWEMRGEPRHHLSSKVLCWVAVDRAVKLADQLGMHAEVDRWSAERDQIREAILTRGWSEARQAYAQSFDSDELDAAQLLMPIFGFLPATDERMRSTIEAIARDLAQDRLVLRYRNQAGMNADGLSGEEGTFVICSFWLVSALAKAGEIDRAEQLFDELISYANDLGLMAEEIDPASGELLGNFPQAFSHIGLISAAAEIDKATERMS
jgi:GH15 family glucan-1,4-alpha-glucosidase